MATEYLSGQETPDDAPEVSPPQPGDNDSAMGYVYGRTLGRHAHDDRFTDDRLYMVLRRLDALLCVIASSETFEGSNGKVFNAFQGANLEIQRSVLDLASELAFEANELHERLHVCGGLAQ